MKKLLFTIALSLFCILPDTAQNTLSWTADNGNGTFTNPLFYDEFSDPDVIRVGEDYYLAGTTMHCTPGLVILHSKDLVNWDLASYCFDRWNDVLPDDKFRLQNGKQVYGQGVWAPVIRYNNGTFYVFTNVNGNGLQLFTSKSAYGPWEHKNLGGHIYDLSVLFDDDGKVWAIHGYDEVKVTQFKPDFSGYVEGSERTIIPKGSAMGEGHHAYKIDGKYYIISAEYSPMGRSQCARAENLFGPYETTAVSCIESLGTQKFPLVTNANNRDFMKDGYKFSVSQPGDNELGCATIHQGGIVQTPSGEWWALSMLDYLAVGRTVCLVPITWQEGWPMFGLKGNPGRSPRTWFKPETGNNDTPHAPYQRNDNFNGKQLSRVWQWNHEPIDNKWMLKNGKLRLYSMPAENFMWARNTLTQRCIGPVSDATVTLNAKNLRHGEKPGTHAKGPRPFLHIRITCQNRMCCIAVLRRAASLASFPRFSGSSRRPHTAAIRETVSSTLSWLHSILIPSAWLSKKSRHRSIASIAKDSVRSLPRLRFFRRFKIVSLLAYRMMWTTGTPSSSSRWTISP